MIDKIIAIAKSTSELEYFDAMPDEDIERILNDFDQEGALNVVKAYKANCERLNKYYSDNAA